jgi:starch synthase
MEEALRVLFLSPEAVPFAKSGGLADVAGSLPTALKRLGADVRLVLPYYRMVREGNFEIRPLLTRLDIPFGSEKLPARIYECRMDAEVPVYLVDREDLYDRPNLYGDARGDYYDNLERFSFFAHAALTLADKVSFGPDLVHCHDWQTALVPVLLRRPYWDTGPFSNVRSVFTIHNVGYQGLFPAAKLPLTGLPSKDYYHPGGLEYWGKISLLKAGIVYSDAITTVSPKYAREIQTAGYGMGMEGVLSGRSAVLHGILNGVDYSRWDPGGDSHISTPYTPKDVRGKSHCKKNLIDDMDLAPSLEEKPLLGMISRLDAQKGLDLLVEILEDILRQDVGLVVLGSGDERIQEAIQSAAQRYPGKVGLKIGFDEPLAHRIMAGVDIFLIPSRYEPCGLTQMYALKYGSVPLVRATGGLDDTIVQYDPETKEGNGFKFDAFEAASFLEAIRQALDAFQDKASWKNLMANGMKADFSWDRSAERYIALYNAVIEDMPFPG